MHETVPPHIALVAFIGTAAAPAVAAEQFINVLTGGTSGVYYPLGVALGNVIGKAMPATKTSVQATKASVENLNLLQAGRGEIAFTPLADLRGKKISVGAPKSGTELNARAILTAAGISYKDFSKVEYLPFGESVELMKNRQLDVTLQSAGLGVASLRDLAAAMAIVVVTIPPDVIKKVNDPAYLPFPIPANTYQGQTTAVPPAAVQNYLVTQDGVSNDVVYGMTKALWTNLDQLVAAHSAAKAIDIKNALLGMPVPLHPRAEKYYREVGVLK